jgi:hypothetical protein
MTQTKLKADQMEGGAGGGGGTPVQIDQSSGDYETYGILSGAINDSNTDFTVSLGVYVSGNLMVYRNGKLQTQGINEDWVEVDPTIGTFRMNTAPTTTPFVDVITAIYGMTVGGSGGGGHIIEDEGTPLTARAKLNFIGSGVTATDDVGNNATNVNIDSAVLIYPTRALFSHINSTVIAGNALTQNTDVPFLGYAYQSPAANGDSFTQSFMLKAGTYTFRSRGFPDGANRGKIDWSIDGSVVISADNWASGTTRRDHTVTVVGDGRHVLTGTINGSTSGNWYMCIYDFSFIPSSDVSEVA